MPASPSVRLWCFERRTNHRDTEAPRSSKSAMNFDKARHMQSRQRLLCLSFSFIGFSVPLCLCGEEIAIDEDDQRTQVLRRSAGLLRARVEGDRAGNEVRGVS